MGALGYPDFTLANGKGEKVVSVEGAMAKGGGVVQPAE
jgi:hypothetical protein